MTCPVPDQAMPPSSATPSGFAEIRVRGKTMQVPSVVVSGIPLVVTGSWLKVAALKDEKVVGSKVLASPELLIGGLRQAKSGADIFTFAQRLPETQPKYPYPFEWDNAAAIPITTYKDWFEKRAATDVKQNVKKSSKRGLVVRPVQFDDEFVSGIVAIYNESPIRQGRRFWHYGKDFATVKRETAHCLENSEFIGAYCRNELVGFIKLLCGGGVADIVLIVSKQSHQDKKPTNALIARAVELCEQKKISYLTYAKYAYGKKADSSLAEFKRRNGFEPIQFPRYYVPLTTWGKIAVRWKLYSGIQERLPASVVRVMVDLRSKFYRLKTSSKSGRKDEAAKA
jgi:hypothetical protein